MKKPLAFSFAVDINVDACVATTQTAAENGIKHLDVLQGDLLTCFGDRIKVCHGHCVSISL